MRGSSVTGGLKLLAGIALGVSLLLPLYSVPTSEGPRAYTHAWRLAGDDATSAGLLAVAFLWPLVPAALRWRARRRVRRIAALVAEPALAVFSATVIVAVRASAFSFVALLPPWLLVPVSGSPAIGSTLGLAADALYLLAWLGGVVASAGAVLRNCSTHSAAGLARTGARG
jgi:hypothetical protein